MYVLVDCEWGEIKETPTSESGSQCLQTEGKYMCFRWN